MHASWVNIDAQRDAIVHCDRKWLRAAHATQTSSESYRAGECAFKFSASDFGETLVGALQDALRADVNPRAGGHLAVHSETEIFETPEFIPCGPVADEIRVRQQYAWRPFVCAKNADGFARLHQHCFVGFHGLHRAHHRIECWPTARCATGAAVDDKIVGAFCNFRI